MTNPRFVGWVQKWVVFYGFFRTIYGHAIKIRVFVVFFSFFLFLKFWNMDAMRECVLWYTILLLFHVCNMEVIFYSNTENLVYWVNYCHLLKKIVIIFNCFVELNFPDWLNQIFNNISNIGYVFMCSFSMNKIFGEKTRKTLIYTPHRWVLAHLSALKI